MCKLAFVAFMTLSLSIAAAPGDASITVDAAAPGVPISPLLYGIFFEEINRAGDGGLYAEMVQNRSFEDAGAPQAWTLVRAEGCEGAIALDGERPLNAHNPHALKLAVAKCEHGRVGVANEGFKGIAVVAGKKYDLSLYARADGALRGGFTASLEGAAGNVLATAAIDGIEGQWKKLACVLTAGGTDAHARLVIAASAPGTVWLDMVSLFPRDTWKSRPNGLRADLAQMLADMKPAFVRFPGGCFVEGNKLANATRWKQTIGDVAERPGHWNLWGYRSTDGLGYLEYLQMCEDLGAAPLFVINCGMAHEDHAPLSAMQEFVQDALDAIQYANGGADTEWGARRAKHGRPAPFKLEYIEIGNENGGPLYQERYNLFYDAIKAKYPHMHLVANVPTSGRPTEILDEHYYSTPEFFIQNAEKYDRYDRKGPAIYVGEYAVTSGAGQGNLRAAVGEAAFMTGMERNADVVVMSSYAPLFVNVGWRQWNPDAICFDAARAFGTPSYHVQKMFSEACGDVVLPVTIDAPLVETASSTKPGGIGVGTWATQAEFKDIQVVQDGRTVYASDFSKGMAGWRPVRGRWEVVDGALRQTGGGEDYRAMVEGVSFADCTISLKARKLGGAEGFLIIFRAPDDGFKSWWNLGGWGNARHAVEIGGIVEPAVNGGIATGKWYDIRVELAGPKIRCFLDGKPVHEIKTPEVRALYAVASRSNARNEVILKVVNVGGKAMPVRVGIRGLAAAVASARANVLASEDPFVENSLAEPRKIAPVCEPFAVTSGSFERTFPANSVTVVRLQLAK